VSTANTLQLEAGRRRAVPIHFNFVARAKFEVAQAIRCRFRAYLLFIRYITLWPWTLTPWPWPLTFDLEHLWWAGCAVVKLCTKFELNLAIRGRVIAVWTLTLWPWTHITCSKLCYVIICTKFKLSQAIRSWNVMIFLTLIRHVTLWPWPLTPWPWTFVVVQASCVQTLCNIWAKSNNPLQSYWRFSYLFPKGGTSKHYSSEGDGPNSTKFGENRAVSMAHSTRNFGSDMLLRFEMTAAQKWVMSKSRPNFTHFDPCKN